MRCIYRCFVLIACISSGNAFGFFTINRVPRRIDGRNWEVAFLGVAGIRAWGYNACGAKVNVLQILDTDACSEQLFKPTAQVRESLFIPTFRYFLPHNFSVSCTLPVLFRKVSDFRLNPVDDAGALPASPITVQTAWSRTGISDCITLAEWSRPFDTKNKVPLTQGIRIDMQLGPSFPTGVRSDETLLLGDAFGGDGAYGVHAAFGINVQTVHEPFIWGVRTEVTKIGSVTRDRSIRIDPINEQARARVRAALHSGVVVRQTVYCALHDIVQWLSLGVGYRYEYQARNHLVLCSDQYSQDVANKDPWLYATKTNDITFVVRYDPVPPQEQVLAPRYGLYFRQPLGGCRSIQEQTFSFDISFDF